MAEAILESNADTRIVEIAENPEDSQLSNARLTPRLIAEREKADSERKLSSKVVKVPDSDLSSATHDMSSASSSANSVSKKRLAVEANKR